MLESLGRRNLPACVHVEDELLDLPLSVLQRIHTEPYLAIDTKPAGICTRRGAPRQNIEGRLARAVGR